MNGFSSKKKHDYPLVKNDGIEGGIRLKKYYKASLSNMPLITIVTIVYNGVKDIEDTILSVINQTYENIEYIVIDAGSSDGTVDIIKKYDTQIDYWVSEKDKGIYDGMNKGANLSSGDWLNFMNAGDSFYSQSVIANLIEYFKDEKVIFGRTKIIDSNNKFWDYPDKSISISDLPKWLENKFPNHQSMFFPKKYFQQNKYDLRYSVSADSHYKKKSLRQLGYVFYEGYIANFYIGGVSSKPNFKELISICHERFERKDFKYRYLDYAYCFIKALIKASLYKIFGERSMFIINKIRHYLL
jgi:putative colanic acid biosynthesis glycosyltransferase